MGGGGASDKLLAASRLHVDEAIVVPATNPILKAPLAYYRKRQWQRDPVLPLTGGAS